MNMYPPSLITVYLLTCAASTTVMLVILLLIACPLVWSRDFRRRARAREALHMLTWLLASRRVK